MENNATLTFVGSRSGRCLVKGGAKGRHITPVTYFLYTRGKNGHLMISLKLFLFLVKSSRIDLFGVTGSAAAAAAAA
ncbi:hypothetical protein DAPPUDRAFT_253400 [Daphnia pulex]|uniref:Uncharacterized protein n=1 Tax=Daphnia pulex TaxID=6669 RepID=E9H4R3_DAPPU|nr:hypothetical protein DAPPUDRAFT_253400 [Daphnia pulex]|eukprot:EFX73193.1 hypothetical protein DAPPUDRAFT_253400 [Daphnia pulex]